MGIILSLKRPGLASAVAARRRIMTIFMFSETEANNVFQ